MEADERVQRLEERLAKWNVLGHRLLYRLRAGGNWKDEDVQALDRLLHGEDER